MRRRLDLAASMILAPHVMFLDEPTTGLDPRGRNEVWAAIRDLVQGGTTVLLTTQYLDEADRLADRIAVIDRGRTIVDRHAVGPQEHGRRRPDRGQVAAGTDLAGSQLLSRASRPRPPRSTPS